MPSHDFETSPEPTARIEGWADADRSLSTVIETWGLDAVAGQVDLGYEPDIEMWFPAADARPGRRVRHDSAIDLEVEAALHAGSGQDEPARSGHVHLEYEVEAWFAPVALCSVRSEPELAREHLLVSSLDDAQLVGTASRWALEGLLEGELVILLSDPSHLGAVLDALPRAERARAESRGMLVTMDVQATLDLILRDGVVDGRLFEEHVTAPLRSLALRAPSMRAYGNMAGRLWAEGNVVGALDIDNRWTALQSVFPLAILCSYPIDTGAGEVDSAVCAVHTPCAAGVLAG